MSPGNWPWDFSQGCASGQRAFCTINLGFHCLRPATWMRRKEEAKHKTAALQRSKKESLDYAVSLTHEAGR